MRILYGVVGEGMGHAMRSRVILEHLVAQGHEIEVIASQRAVDFLKKRFEGKGADIHRVHGLHIVYEDNRMRLGNTVWANILGGTAAIPAQIASYFEVVKDFAPEVVISDFESWTYYFAKTHSLPILSIDNQQIINRCRIDDEAIEGHRAQFEVTKAFVKSKLPFCDHYLITTFFFPPVRKEKTSLFPPILRPEILSAKRSVGDHLLVYQTAEGGETLERTLHDTGLPCRVYGMRRGIQEEQVEGNLRFRPFSETGFIDDLASARGVIAGGGFTLMGEAVYLHKPMLSVPVGGQYEQILNGRYLQKLGYGHMADTLDDPRTVFDFVAALDTCAKALESYAQDGNKAILAAVDQHLDRAAAGVYT